jgi:MraZ protein
MTLSKNTFIGEFSYTLDSKGRLNIPSKFRQSLSKDNKETFVIARGLDQCIWVYPLIEWKQIENNLRKLSSISNTHRRFIRNTARYASPSTYDKQGRIILHPSLIEYAGLDKEVLIIGMINKMEIWNPDLLEKFENKQDELNSEAYEELSNKIIL